MSENISIPQLLQKKFPWKNADATLCLSFISVTADNGKTLNDSLFFQSPDSFEVFVLY
jgi:hypothetical protein